MSSEGSKFYIRVEINLEDMEHIDAVTMLHHSVAYYENMCLALGDACKKGEITLDNFISMDPEEEGWLKYKLFKAYLDNCYERD